MEQHPPISRRGAGANAPVSHRFGRWAAPARVMLKKKMTSARTEALGLECWWQQCFRQNCLAFAVK